MSDDFKKQCLLDFQRATDGNKTMDLMQFVKVTHCRSRFYAVAVFDIINQSEQSNITFDDYLAFRRLLAQGTVEDKSQFAFSLLDRDKDGWLNRDDLRNGLRASAVENEQDLSEAELEKLLCSLMAVFVRNSDGQICFKTFTNVLRSYPDLLGAFTIGNHLSVNNDYTPNGVCTRVQNSLKKIRKWIVNRPTRCITYLMTLCLISAAFFWQIWKFSGDCDDVDLTFVDPLTHFSRRDVQLSAESMFGIHISDTDARYMTFSEEMDKHDPICCQDARKRVFLSWTLPLAKGCGRALKVIFTLILFPVSRSLMTRLRDTSLRRVFDFDGAISYHKLLGRIGFLLSWVHSLAHFVHVYRMQDSTLYKEWRFMHPPSEMKEVILMQNLTKDSPQQDGVPIELLKIDGEEQPTALKILSSPIAFTGFALLAIYTIAAMYALDYPRKLKFFQPTAKSQKNEESWMYRFRKAVGVHLNDFSNFWYSHHLFALFYVVFIFHPFPESSLDNERGQTDAWLWVLIPVLVYIIERSHRALQRAESTRLIDITPLPGKVLALKTKKPVTMDYKAGQYVIIKCNKISKFEWHPFTLTSAPHDSYLGLHIRAVGDWTTAMYEKLKDCQPTSQSEEDLEAARIGPIRKYPVNLQVAGPYGAPAQTYEDYKVVVCVGAGIGVTPFASILREVLHSIQSTKGHNTTKVYFHWVVRSRSEASWFSPLLQRIAVDDIDGVLSTTIHVTSMKNASDLRLMLLRLAQFEQRTSNGSAGLGLKSITRFGRPNWAKILTKYKEDHKDESKIGVFFCGPNPLKKDLKAQCYALASSSPKFIFNKEIF